MPAVEPITISPRRRRWNRLAAEVRLSCQQRWHQAKLSIQWWRRRQTPYTPVFVLATHRSGSNLLVDYLNRVPGVSSHSEVLCTTLPFGLRARQSHAGTAVRHIRRSLQTLRSPIRGCKLMLDQLTHCRLSLDALRASFPEAKFLVLYRQSLAEQFLSWEVAKATAQWILVDRQESPQIRIHVDAAKLRAYSEKIRAAYCEILNHAWLPERSVLLSYEELTAEPAKWLDEHICPLLGTPSAIPETRLRKQNTLPLQHRVANYDDVAPLLNSPLCRQHYAAPQRRQAIRPAA